MLGELSICYISAPGYRPDYNLVAVTHDSPTSTKFSVLFILSLFEVYLLWPCDRLLSSLAPSIFGDQETGIDVLLTHWIVIILGRCPCLQGKHVYKVFILVDGAWLTCYLLIRVLQVLEVGRKADVCGPSGDHVRVIVLPLGWIF